MVSLAAKKWLRNPASAHLQFSKSFKRTAAPEDHPRAPRKLKIIQAQLPHWIPSAQSPSSAAVTARFTSHGPTTTSRRTDDMPCWRAIDCYTILQHFAQCRAMLPNEPSRFFSSVSVNLNANAFSIAETKPLESRSSLIKQWLYCGIISRGSSPNWSTTIRTSVVITASGTSGRYWS